MFFIKKPLCIMIAAMIISSWQASATLQVPPGFEELTKGQVVWLDITLYGESLGLFQAKVDLEKVSFLNPNKIISAITERYGDTPGLKTVLTSGLSKPLARNGELSCEADSNLPGCDYLTTKSVSIIYDESSARVMLFLASRFTPKEKTGDVYFLSPPDTHNGFIHQQNVNFVADNEYQSASVQGNGTLGLTDSGYANLDWAFNGQRYRQYTNTQVQVSNAYFRQDIWRKFYFQAGQMDSRDIFSRAGGGLKLSQLPIGKIRGVRVGSTMAWVNQEKVVNGTPVTVFLSRDSRVDAYRDSQLLQSFYLGTGAQQLDTRGFPSGSYEVRLQIFEDNQLVRTQTIPYTSLGDSTEKSFQWFLQAGQLVDNYSALTDDNQQAVLGGARIPLTRNLALTTGTTILNNANYQEGGLDWNHGFASGALLDGVLNASASYLHGSDGSTGNVQQASYNDGFSLSYYRTTMTSHDCNTMAEKRYSFSGCYKSSNIMFSVPVQSWYTTLGYSTSQNEGRYVYRSELPEDDKNYNAGAPWDQIFTTRSRSKAWQIGLNKTITWEGLNLTTSLNAFTRRDTGYQGTDNGGFISVSAFWTGRSDQGSSSSSNSSLSTTWRKSRQNNGELGYSGSYNRYLDKSGDNEFGASLSGVNTQNVSATVLSRYGGQYGRSSLALSDTWSKQTSKHTLSTSGNYNSSLVIDGDGLYWGRWGDGMPSSAFTVGVNANHDDKAARLNVSVDNAGQADIRGNTKALFTVPGYQQSTVSFSEPTDVSNGASSEINRGAGSRTLFMTPGKVFNRKISISSRYTWLGKLTDANGRPFNDVSPLNVTSWIQGDDGGFSMETRHPMETLYVKRGGDYLKCPIHVRQIKDVVRWVGTVHCENIPLINIPEEERVQAELDNPN